MDNAIKRLAVAQAIGQFSFAGSSSRAPVTKSDLREINPKPDPIEPDPIESAIRRITGTAHRVPGTSGS